MMSCLEWKLLLMGHVGRFVDRVHPCCTVRTAQNEHIANSSVKFICPSPREDGEHFTSYLQSLHFVLPHKPAMDATTERIVNKFACEDPWPTFLWYVTYSGDPVNGHVLKESEVQFTSHDNFKTVVSNQLHQRFANTPFTSAFGHTNPALSWASRSIPRRTEFVLYQVDLTGLYVFDARELVKSLGMDTSDVDYCIPYWVLGKIPSANIVERSICELRTPSSPMVLIEVMDRPTIEIVDKYEVHRHKLPQFLYRVQCDDDDDLTSRAVRGDTDYENTVLARYLDTELDFVRHVENHLNWISQPTPFVSAFRTERDAIAWATRMKQAKNWSAYVVARINTGKLIHVFHAADLVERLGINTNSKWSFTNEFLVLARIPHESVEIQE